MVVKVIVVKRVLDSRLRLRFVSFSLSVINKEGLCTSSEDINRLMMYDDDDDRVSVNV
jgi:hypothetical protein